MFVESIFVYSPYFYGRNTGKTKYFLIQLSGLKPLLHQNMENTQNGFYNHLRQEYNQQLVTNIKILTPERPFILSKSKSKIQILIKQYLVFI